jgi:hypothetical protein
MMTTLARIVAISAIIISTLLAHGSNAAAQQKKAKKRIRSSEEAKKARSNKLDWSEALAKWAAFSEKHLDKMQELNKSSERRQFTEVRSGLIYKYLPKHRFFTDEYLIFALNLSGEITPLGMGLGSVKPEMSGFMMKQEIKVTDASIAIEVVKLMEDIMSAPSSIKMLRKNINNYKIFDKSMYRRLSGETSHWKYHATIGNGIWTVQMEYIGPPEYSIITPATWEILVDHIGRIKEVRQQHRETILP